MVPALRNWDMANAVATVVNSLTTTSGGAPAPGTAARRTAVEDPPSARTYSRSEEPGGEYSIRALPEEPETPEPSVMAAAPLFLPARYSVTVAPSIGVAPDRTVTPRSAAEAAIAQANRIAPRAIIQASIQQGSPAPPRPPEYGASASRPLARTQVRFDIAGPGGIYRNP